MNPNFILVNTLHILLQRSIVYSTPFFLQSLEDFLLTPNSHYPERNSVSTNVVENSGFVKNEQGDEFLSATNTNCPYGVGTMY